MPVNLELKLKLDSNRKTKTILKRINADFQTVLKQRDVYFKIKDGLLKLRIQNTNCELIKYIRDESGNTRWSNYEIIKIDGNNVEKFFKSVFEIETIVEKKRELWLYHNTRIHLDTVKNLGTFLELETLVLNGKSNAEKRFNEIISLLQLDLKKQILFSYRDLMLKIQ
ncbi:MAG: class IV adenylate cyclase [Ignavibacteriales bacterium]|nr:class IV adenylate cyclase [Ignavibacteriales bacterium]